MRILILFLHGFVNTFGLTQPKPEEERKWALYLAGMLALMFAAVAAGVTLIFFGTGFLRIP